MDRPDPHRPIAVRLLRGIQSPVASLMLIVHVTGAFALTQASLAWDQQAKGELPTAPLAEDSHADAGEQLVAAAGELAKDVVTADVCGSADTNVARGSNVVIAINVAQSGRSNAASSSQRVRVRRHGSPSCEFTESIETIGH